MCEQRRAAGTAAGTATVTATAARHRRCRSREPSHIDTAGEAGQQTPTRQVKQAADFDEAGEGRPEAGRIATKQRVAGAGDGRTVGANTMDEQSRLTCYLLHVRV